MPSKPPVIQQRKYDGAGKAHEEPHCLVDGVELPVIGLGSVDGEDPDPTQSQRAQEEEQVGAAQPVRDAYLLGFLAPGDGDRRTRPYCAHRSKIHNLYPFGNAGRKSAARSWLPLSVPGEEAAPRAACKGVDSFASISACFRRNLRTASGCGRRGAWRLYCCPV